MTTRSIWSANRHTRRAQAKTSRPHCEALEGRPLLSTIYMDLRPLHNSFAFTDANGTAGSMNLTGTAKGADNGQVLVTYKTVGTQNFVKSVQILDSPNPNFTLGFSSKAGAGRTLILPQVTASAAGAYNGIVTNGPGMNFMLTGYSGAEPLSPTGSINVGEVAGPITVSLKAGQSLRAGNVDAGATVTILPPAGSGTVSGSAILGNVSGAVNVNGVLGSTGRLVVNSVPTSGSLSLNGGLATGSVLGSSSDLMGTVNVNGPLQGTITVVGHIKNLSVYGDAGPGSVIQSAGDAFVFVNGGNESGTVKGRNMVLKVNRNVITGAGGNVYAGAIVNSAGTQMLSTDGNFGGLDHSGGALTAVIGTPTTPADVTATSTFLGDTSQNLNVTGSFNGADQSGTATLTVGKNVGPTASLISDASLTLSAPGTFDGQIRANALNLNVGGSVGSMAAGSTIVAKDVTGFAVGGDYDGTLTVINSFDPGGTSATPIVVGGNLNGDISIPTPTNPAIFQLVFGGNLAGNLLISNDLTSDLVVKGNLSGGLTLQGEVGTAASNDSILVAGDFSGYVNTPDAFSYDPATDNYWFYDVNHNVNGNLAVGGKNTGQVNLLQP